MCKRNVAEARYYVVSMRSRGKWSTILNVVERVNNRQNVSVVALSQLYVKSTTDAACSYPLDLLTWSEGDGILCLVGLSYLSPPSTHLLAGAS